jgi:hypothetical protein
MSLFVKGLSRRPDGGFNLRYFLWERHGDLTSNYSPCALFNLRVSAALRPAALRILVIAAFFPAALRLRVAAAFFAAAMRSVGMKIFLRLI